jgi:lysozyme family protein
MLPNDELNKALDKVILAEGHGYTNHPADRGGPTKYGITLATLKSIPKYTHATADTVAGLTLPEARNIYLTLYASPFTFIEYPMIFNFLFNSAVQHGVKGATKMMQRALGIEDDGVIGPQTRAAVNNALQQPAAFFAKLIAERCEYYANILIKDHSQRVFAAGWLNRIAKDLT